MGGGGCGAGGRERQGAPLAGGEGEGRRRMEDGDWKVLANCLVGLDCVVLCCVLSRPRPACIGSTATSHNGQDGRNGWKVATHQAKQTTTSEE